MPENVLCCETRLIILLHATLKPHALSAYSHGFILVSAVFWVNSRAMLLIFLHSTAFFGFVFVLLPYFLTTLPQPASYSRNSFPRWARMSADKLSLA